eukprot:Plantae.Rhodophyta-Rhodochaete_pulchella.ctg5630.p1 GENE.Plantae.Rhodophyta-Rhodochaete_pulchella.ctg5630~~Plantae.Rhodophyta-Rhodochaete_pulchella.ctg5630.p1  ORF type:complete len:356 (-),score=61.36 Plantae.Rhodophyta-Rhodochaete_pulchella.ctg5630:1230-2198(-)
MACADTNKQKAIIADELKSPAADPDMRMTEALHATAYAGNTLGLPLVAEERKLNALDPAALSDFLSSNVGSDRIVVAAANVDHHELVRVTEEALGSVGKAPASSVKPSVYTGGESRVSGDGLAQVALGFHGVSWNDQDLVPVAVLHSLLGGGGSFSSGGPGKGMYTRLYTRVLTEEPWVHSAQAFNHVYSDSGVFGIAASAEPGRLGDLAKLVAENAAGMVDNLSDEEVQRAQNQTISGLIMNLESRAILCEDIGRQTMVSGKYLAPATLAEWIARTSKEDLQRVAAKILRSSPTLVLQGDMYDTPSIGQIDSTLKSAQITA